MDDFLKNGGILEHTETTAIKRVITWQMKETMKKKHISKIELTGRMHTSRSALDRLLDPENDSVTLSTLNKAAKALGKTLLIEMR